MTDQQPITPPPELVLQWIGEFFGCTAGGELSDSERFLTTQAARWGADQELEACCEYLTRCAAWEPEDIQEMRDLRRPKPPSLKELNLKHLEVMERHGHYLPEIISDLRRAIESLPD